MCEIPGSLCRESPHRTQLRSDPHGVTEMAAFDEEAILSDPVLWQSIGGRSMSLSDDEDGGWVDAVPDLDFDEVSDFIADTHLGPALGPAMADSTAAAARRAARRARETASWTRSWGE